MRYAIGWVVSQALFWLGHLVSKTITNRIAIMYPLYNWLMSKSCQVSDWSGAGVWLDSREVE